MILKFSLSLLTYSLCLKNVISVDQSIHAPGTEVIKEENTKNPVVNAESVAIDRLKISKKSDKVIELPLDRTPENAKGLYKKEDGLVKKEPSQLVIEGGGMIDFTSTAQPSPSILELEKDDDGSNHSKGSKPRKGVQHPGSSIVPRKGVDSYGAFGFNKSTVVGETKDPTKETTSVISSKQMPSNKTELLTIKPDHQQLDEPSTPKVHPKKPVVVTDIEDANDFDKYPIIQTSTTGEDYIIIGIVIVLGIWCSIFGALIFYRRAGEYWDRRHYRRMDFLVEGMYND